MICEHVPKYNATTHCLQQMESERGEDITHHHSLSLRISKIQSQQRKRVSTVPKEFIGRPCWHGDYGFSCKKWNSHFLAGTINGGESIPT